MDFSVWAPGHDRVDLVLEDGQRFAMRPEERGWWRTSHGTAGDGVRYRYSLDGGPPRPDPRSYCQPSGVDGPSEAIDHANFVWHDTGWSAPAWPPAAIYELHIGTFSTDGTCDGAITHLQHLVDLGVDAIEVLPVAEFSGDRGWGYDGVDLWAPHHSYGGPAGLKRLVDACHGHGLAVLLDVVYNHLGPSGNYLGDYGPYFTEAYGTPWGTAVNFDGKGSYGVRDFVISNAMMWYRDYHIDGLRLDAVHAIYDESALHVLEELSSAVDALSVEMGRSLWLVAENDRNDPRVARPRGEHGYGLSAVWDDDFHHALHSVLTGEVHGYYSDFGRIGHLAKAFTDGFVYDGAFSEYRQRRQGRPAAGSPGSVFVCCLQDHDQIGNRALGERTSHLMGADLLKVGAALLLCSPFVPMLFQGEEWAASTPFLYFTDHRDPDLARAVSEGRRREHPLEGGNEVPDPQAEETFLRSKLDWAEVDREPHRCLLEWHRRLLALRRQEPELSVADRNLATACFDEDRRWLVVHRGSFRVAANFADTAQLLPLGAGDFVAVLASDGAGSVERVGEGRDGAAVARLGPRSVAIARLGQVAPSAPLQ